MSECLFSSRLREAMDSRGLKQIDLLNLAAPYCQQYHVHLGKSALCQYLSGAIVPRQDKLIVLARALNVSESWLLGYESLSSENSDSLESQIPLQQFLRQFREEHDLSQRQFASLCGLSNGYISMLEKGINPNTQKPLIPSLQNFQKLANGMDMSLASFLSRISDVSLDDILKTPESSDILDEQIQEALSPLNQNQKKQILAYVRFLAQYDETVQK